MNRFFTSLLSLLLLLAGTTEGQVVLRYGENIDGGWGDASAVITPYVKFPKAFVAPYAGNRMTKVSIGLCKPATNVYLYIKKSPEDSKPIYRQKLDSLDAGWNEIQLDTPFDITGSDDIAIGYKASFAEAGGVGYSKEVYSDGDFIYYNSKNKWTSTQHSICIRALVEGDRLPENELLMGGMSSMTAPSGATEATFTGWVRNVGANEVGSYSLRYGFDGDEKVMEIEHSLQVNMTDTFSVTVPAVSKGTHQLWVAVNTVNGTQDAYLANDTARVTLTVRDPSFRRNVVCEEYTGLWCGWCPRGLVGLELMKEAHPGQFIAISAHGGDTLTIPSDIPNYESFTSSCSGAPMCNVDRRLTGDPFTEIKTLFAMEQASTSHIAYSLSAQWNVDSTAMEVASDFYSDIDMQSPNYHIAYTVTEDSITGYSQTNYYAGNSSEFYGWEKKAGLTDDVVFNDLARAVYPSYEGDPCRTEPMVAGEHYAHTYTVPVPANVVDRRNIHVVGQIIDHSTGYIVNAMSVVPTGGVAGVSVLDGADGVKAFRTGNLCRLTGDGPMRADVYNVAGRLIDSKAFSGSATVNVPWQGTVIIRVVKDGRTTKVFKLK